MSNFIVSCLLAKAKQGLLDSDVVNEVSEMLKGLGPKEAQKKSLELIDQYQIGLDATVRKNINHLDNMARYENIIKSSDTLNFRTLSSNLQYEFATKLRDSQEAILADLGHVWPNTLNKIRDQWWNRDALKASTSMDVMNAFYGLGGKSPEAQIWAQELNQLQAHIHQRLLDSGTIRTAPTKPFIPINFNGRLLAKYSPTEFMNDVLRYVDREHFDKVIGAHLNKYKGNLTKYFDDLYKTYLVGYRDKDMPIKSYELEEVFEDAVRALNPEAWHELSYKYGDGHLFNSIINSHRQIAQRIARDTNLVSFNHASKSINSIKKQLRAAGKYSEADVNNLGLELEKRIKYAFNRFDRYSFDTTGVNIAEDVIGTSKNVLIGSAIGGITPVAALTDPVTGAFARMARGMDVVPGLFQTLRTVFMYKKTQQELLKAGIMMDFFKEDLMGQARFVNNSVGLNWSQKWAQFGTKLSFLNRVTNAGRSGNLKTAVAHLQEWSSTKTWSKLDEDSKFFLQRSGIFEKEWGDISEAVKNTKKGQLLDLTLFLDSDKKELRDLGLKVGIFLQNLKNAGTPTDSYELDVIKKSLSSQLKYGAPIARTFTTFMNYSTSLLEDHILLPLRREGMYGLRYTGLLVAALAVMQSFGQDIQDALAGKKPMPLDDPLRWKKASTAALGPFGNYLLQAFVHGQGGATLGAPVDAVAGVGRALMNGTVRYLDNDPSTEAHLQRDLVRSVWTFFPKNWYVKGIFERTIKDQFLRMIDPDADRYFNKQIQNQQRHGGYWWQPGAPTPD